MPKAVSVFFLDSLNGEAWLYSAFLGWVAALCSYNELDRRSVASGASIYKRLDWGSAVPCGESITDFRTAESSSFSDSSLSLMMRMWVFLPVVCSLFLLTLRRISLSLPNIGVFSGVITSPIGVLM